MLNTLSNQVIAGFSFIIVGVIILIFHGYLSRLPGMVGYGEPRSLKEIVGTNKSKKAVFNIGVIILFIGLILLMLALLNIDIGLY